MALTKPPRALRREWYARLKAAGFEDIETGAEHDGLLKTDKRIEAARGEEYAASADYYRRAGVFLHHRGHWAPGEREVWEAHASGLGMNEIARTVHLGNTRVHGTITRLAAEMLGNAGTGSKGPPPYPRHFGHSGNRRAKRKRGRPPYKPSERFYSWVERETRKLSDADLLAMAPDLLAICRSTPRRS